MQDLGIGLLFDHIRDAIVVADVESDRIVLLNRVAEDLFGYSAEEAIGQPVTLLMPERYKAVHLAGMRHFRETGHGRLIDSNRALELPGRHQSGREFYLELSLSPIPSRIGKRRFVLAVIRDVTERKNAELALAEQKELLERLITHMPAAIAFLDRDLTYRWNNPAHSRLIGLPAERILGRRVEAVLGEGARTVVPLLKRVLESDEPFHAQALPIRLGDGAVTTHWDLSYVPIRDASGTQLGILSLASEATERVAVERLQRQRIEELQHLSTLKDQFLSVLSHELRTPIQCVTGFGSLLDDEVAGPLNAEQHAFIKKILGASDVLIGLVNDMLDMSSIRAGKFLVEPSPVPASPLIAGAVEAYRAPATEKQLRLSWDVPADLPCLWADSKRVAQVIGKLVDNAIKFTPAGGSVAVRARAGKKWLVLSIADSGIGITPEQHALLFQPFTQVDMSSTRSVGGIGLGLSISKAIVEAHHGRIGVRSIPGKGSLFWVALPLSPPGSC
ncbi:PAS domain S-box protein [bacterium]|nr:PAS domain S-box protein [bacterium]